MTLLEHITRDGNIVGYKDAGVIHGEHLLHRSVHILLINTEGEIFLRQRPESKTLYPKLWTSSVGAHVVLGQTPEQAAKENLKSYLGVSASLVFLGNQQVEDAVENELTTFYLVRTDNIPIMNTEQSMDQGYKSIAEIDQLMRDGYVTPYIAVGLELYRDYIKNQQ